VHARARLGGGDFFRRRLTPQAVLAAETLNERPDGYVEHAAGVGVKPGGGCKTFHRGDADTDELAGPQAVDLRNVAAGDETAEFPLKAVAFIERRLGRLPGIPLFLTGDYDLERRGHRVVRKAVDRAARFTVRLKCKGGGRLGHTPALLSCIAQRVS
jgi:hypothetical protein